MIYGDRIRQARVLRRVPSGDLARMLNRTPSSITRLESAEFIEDDEGLLDLLTRSLEFPRQFFQRTPGPTLRSEQLLFRAPKSTLKREKDYLAEYARMVGELLDWLSEINQLPPVKIPRLESGASGIYEGAATVRAALGIQPGAPIPHVMHPIERAGAPIVVKARAGDSLREGKEAAAVGEKHLGYSTHTGEFWDRPVIILRTSLSWERTRWTVAHELGHLALHTGAIPPEAEDEANRFANEFLAPVDYLRTDLPRSITLFALIDLKLKWGISLAALIRHLHANGLIGDDRKIALQRQLYTRRNPQTGRTYGVDEPGWDEREPERPRLVSAWLERCVGSVDPSALEATNGLWPADLLDSVLSGQRAGRSQHPRSGTTSGMRSRASKGYGLTGEVIDLSARRNERVQADRSADAAKRRTEC